MKHFNRLASEPFFHFVVIGLFIWAVGSFSQSSGSDDHYLITVDHTQRERLAEMYERQYAQTPSAEQVDALVERFIKEEIFWREGLAMGLAENDEIVRRRVVQKFEFLQSDLAIADKPSPQELKDWFERNKEPFVVPARVSFQQVYIRADDTNSESAQARARRMLAELSSAPGRDTTGVGDAFPAPDSSRLINETIANRIFGRSQFTSKLFTIPLQQWQGPYRSGYGWHLVFVTERKEATTPPFADISDHVLAEFLRQQKRQRNELVWTALREKYRIVQSGASP